MKLEGVYSRNGSVVVFHRKFTRDELIFFKECGFSEDLKEKKSNSVPLNCS